MHISNIIFLTIVPIILLYLFFSLFISYKSPIKSPNVMCNIFEKNPESSLLLSVSFLIVVTVIFTYILSTVPISNHNPQTFYPLNPYNIYLHLTMLVFALFLIILKIVSYKDMGFIFEKNTLNDGLILSGGLIFLIPSLLLRTLFLQETLTISIGSPLLYITTGIILNPVSEEVFFRGILQSKLQTIKKLPGFLALFLGSLAYALFHIPKILFTPEFVSLSKPLIDIYKFPSLPFLWYLFFGLYYGYIYQKTKSIYWSILAHIIFSLIYYTFIII